MDPQDQSPQPQLPPDDKPETALKAQGQDEDGSEAPPASRLSRRSFVLRAMTVLGAVAVAIVAVPAGAFMSAPGWLSTAPRRLLSHTAAGSLEKLRIGQPKHMIIDRPIIDGWVKRDAPVGVYVLRESDSKATVIDPHCTHLGCPVEFSSGSGSFLCPCHGGSFDPEGYPTSGPPPRRMDVYETSVEDGEVLFRHLLDPE